VAVYLQLFVLVDVDEDVLLVASQDQYLFGEVEDLASEFGVGYLDLDEVTQQVDRPQLLPLLFAVHYPPIKLITPNAAQFITPITI
jgi:hypothetical protein